MKNSNNVYTKDHDTAIHTSVDFPRPSSSMTTFLHQLVWYSDTWLIQEFVFADAESYAHIGDTSSEQGNRQNDVDHQQSLSRPTSTVVDKELVEEVSNS